MSNKEVIEEVCDKGYRLPKPTIIDMPDEVYSLMQQMWNSDPEKRPTFETIFDQLRNIRHNFGFDVEADIPLAPSSNQDTNYKDGSALGLDEKNEENYNSLSFKESLQTDEPYNSGNLLGLRD